MTETMQIAAYKMDTLIYMSKPAIAAILPLKDEKSWILTFA
jgi:hypothetical protein